jgi:hypothetical protein
MILTSFPVQKKSAEDAPPEIPPDDPPNGNPQKD